MPVIAYQSFNANSNTNHSLLSLQLQHFTKLANNHAVNNSHQALVLPLADNNLTGPVEGPAQLKTIEPLAQPQTLSVFGGQVSLFWQNIYRAFGAMPDIMVLGEVDLSDVSTQAMVTAPDVSFSVASNARACQSFSAITQTQVASGIKEMFSGEGYYAMEIGGLNVVFVHVPNDISTSRSATQDFYCKIAAKFHVAKKIIHLVIGDTNQPNFNFTHEVLNIGMGTNAYQNALASKGVTKIDNWNVTEQGTNTTGTKMYDIAVYRSDLVELLKGPAYISQSSGGITVTDHCGLAVAVRLRQGTS